MALVSEGETHKDLAKSQPQPSPRLKSLNQCMLLNMHVRNAGGGSDETKRHVVYLAATATIQQDAFFKDLFYDYRKIIIHRQISNLL